MFLTFELVCNVFSFVVQRHNMPNVFRSAIYVARNTSGVAKQKSSVARAIRRP